MQELQVENRRKKAVSRSRDDWQNIIEEWKKSNESQKIFCKRLGIKLGTFTHWRGIILKDNNPKPHKFIPIKMAASMSSTQQIIIETPNGFKITLPCDIAEMIKILNYLGINHA